MISELEMDAIKDFKRYTLFYYTPYHELNYRIETDLYPKIRKAFFPSVETILMKRYIIQLKQNYFFIHLIG
jgi:hypothetical protein